MAAGDLVYGTRTVLANIARLHSNVNGLAEAFGEVDNSTELAMDYQIHLIVPIHASAVGGTYDLYLVESQDGVEWTDNIDPATVGDVAAKLSDAKLIDQFGTVYNATTRTDVEIHLHLSELGIRFPTKYFGFVLDNNSGQTIPASGADGDSQSLKIAAA